MTKLLATVVTAQLVLMVSTVSITLMTATQIHAIIIPLVKMVSTVIPVFVIQVCIFVVFIVLTRLWACEIHAKKKKLKWLIER